MAAGARRPWTMMRRMACNDKGGRVGGASRQGTDGEGPRPKSLCPWPHVLCRRKPTGRRADLRGPGEHDGDARVGLWKRAGAAAGRGAPPAENDVFETSREQSSRAARSWLSARPSAQPSAARVLGTKKRDETSRSIRERKRRKREQRGSPRRARVALRTRDGVDSLRPCALQKIEQRPLLSSCASAMGGPGASHYLPARAWPAWLAAAQN